jgi:CBS domain-containing protein
LEVDVIRVERILPAGRKRLITIRDEAPLMDAAKLLREPDADLVVVCNADERMVGVISKTDVVRQISQWRESEYATAASIVMTRAVVSFRPDDLLHDVWTTMKHRRLKNVPILDQDCRPIAVLNARDVLEALLEEVEHEEMLLRDYVMSIGHPRI